MFAWARSMFGASGSGRPGDTDDFWYGAAGQGSSAGVTVTHDNVLTLPAVLACVSNISETVASLPLAVFRAEGSSSERLREHPLTAILHDKSNSEHTAAEFRDTMCAWVLTRGTAYAEVVPGRTGAVGELVPIHPASVRPFWVTNDRGRREVHFEVSETGMPSRRLLRSELYILRSKVWGQDNQVCGIDIVTQQRELFGAALALQEFAARFFVNDARPSFGIKVPIPFKDDESRNHFRKAWQRFSTGSNRHKIGIFENGSEPVNIAMTNEQAQFLETRRSLDLAIAQVFRMQPHKIGILDNATFSNIEQQSIEHVVDTLTPWLVRWEQSIKRDLITEPDLFAQHNVAGLLRGDIESRYQAYSTARNWGWMSVNDVRDLENMNPIPNGDTYLQPLNMTPAGTPVDPSPRVAPRQQPRQASAAYSAPRHLGIVEDA